MKIQQLSIPPTCSPEKASDPNYVPNPLTIQESAKDWAIKHSLKNVASDPAKVHLLIIDAQRDFCFPSGALFVGGRSGTGSMDDNNRLSEFIYKNIGVISQITPTMDTHLPFQIFHPAAHLNDKGKHPEAGSTIVSDYRNSGLRPNPAMATQLGVPYTWLQNQFIYYCDQLRVTDKSALQIWPYHCMLGQPGHSLVGSIGEAVLFHSFARGAANVPEIKGGNPLTEHYSIFKPEVMTTFDGKQIPGVQKNVRLFETLLRSQVVIVAGQAKSHCLAWSVNDLLNEIKANDPDLAKKVYILEDCTSSVVIPGVIDFTDNANEAFQRFSDEGMNIVKSTDPIESWPGFLELVS